MQDSGYFQKMTEGLIHTLSLIHISFSNTLKRGDLQVIKSSEDNLVEGVTFHLYGTSLSGISVDEYAVTDKNGVATFKDVLISGTTRCV